MTLLSSASSTIENSTLMPEKKYAIPLCKPDIGIEEASNVLSVLASGFLTSGPWVEKLETALAQEVGCKYAVAVNSCTSALILALKALDITGEVILPSFTFAATANAIVLAGATPVFADILPDTYNIDPSHIESLITPNTEAIIPVHFAGQSCDMDRIQQIATEYHLAIIEDCAEALGASYRDQPVGSFGTGCFSFFPTKAITTGEGGAITTNDPTLASRCCLLRAHGVVKSGFHRSTVEPGYNFRLSDILASIGLPQLSRLDTMNAARKRAARYYNISLPGYLGLPTPAPYCNHVYQMYPLILLPQEGFRDKFVDSLRLLSIEASVHFDPPVHLHPYYQSHYSSPPLPITEEVSRTIATLPIFPSITQEQLDTVVNAVHHTVRELRREMQ